ncbi:MAG: hypothetical protein NT075_22935 [Chloroflexi bacterium]|nr:hypothetical protein [Chloroflexota bacterium]
MKYRRLAVIFLSVVILVAAWVLQSGSRATAWANEQANVVAATTIATIPNAFSYQGTLRLADGNLATGSYNITLKIYNVVTGGAALYTESFANVVVRNGNFSVVVGDATAIAPTVFDNANLYIGITVAPDLEMLPRQRLFPVPWAMQAGQAQSAVTAATATTLVKDATIDGLIINKGATNDGALRLVSSGPGWGSGIRFVNNAGNVTWGIYAGSDGAWSFVNEGGNQGIMRIENGGPMIVYRNLNVNANVSVSGSQNVSGNFTTGSFIQSSSNIIAQGKVYAQQGFNGYCRGSGPIDVRCDQDVAETFATDERVEPGNLVVFIPEDRAFPAVRLSSKPYEGAIVGVVSTSPGLVFDQGETHLAGDNANLITDKKTVVAMVGRVPTKFSLENGPIAVGDPLTSSRIPGAAMKATKAGQIIGYAMQSSAAAKEGKLLVWLQLGMYIPQATLDALNAGAATNSSAVDPAIAELKAQVAELAAQVAKLQAVK